MCHFWVHTNYEAFLPDFEPDWTLTVEAWDLDCERVAPSDLHSMLTRLQVGPVQVCVSFPSISLCLYPSHFWD